MHHTSIEDSVGRYEDRQNSDCDLETLLKAKYGDLLYKKEQDAKHRYVIFVGNKKQKRDMQLKLKYKSLPYPKGDNQRYDASYQPPAQGVLI